MSNDDITTKTGRDGIERWECGTPVSQDNAFRRSFDGRRLDVKTMAANAASSAATSRRVAREVARGNNIGKITGLSRKSDELTRARAANYPAVNKAA